MKKFTKKLIALAFVLILSLGVFPSKADAVDYNYSYNIASFNQNTWVNAQKQSYTRSGKSCTYNYCLYEIIVPESGYIKIDSKNQNSQLRIYQSLNKSGKIGINTVVNNCKGASTYYAVLPKGTYYIFNNDSINDTQIRWKFVKTQAPFNYSKGRATELAAGKKEVINYSYDDEFDRWYKIKLTKNKTLSLDVKVLDDNNCSMLFDMRDSRGKTVKTQAVTKSGSSKLVRTDKLTKGTYYVRFYPREVLFQSKYSKGRLGTFSWK
ncbi:hypothetical protein [Butyrivibrio sp. YAB3001]|uniref:hypothetical protein n=1 Tax=Butyrivibrio sp. YAB3001 TaxID=1520812 RepID=UPI0008F649C7|nr:hypothetical protein [Butyrivibrio sp. YAB3001]SFB70361.1 hypothetical protein SAMN02910398_00336 [Butyrivibrio sp. YAB3001]